MKNRSYLTTLCLSGILLIGSAGCSASPSSSQTAAETQALQTAASVSTITGTKAAPVTITAVAAAPSTKPQATKSPVAPPPATKPAATSPVTKPISTTAPAEAPEELTGYANGIIEYQVPESWTENAANESTKYYYPDNGMLMVSFTEIDDSIRNEKSREDYMEGIASDLDYYQLLSESEITVAGTAAYRHEIDNTIDGNKRNTTMITFDYKDGFVSI